MNTFLSLVFSIASGTFVLAAWTPELVTALLGGLGALITGIILLLDRLKHVEKSVNGNMEKALDAAIKAAEARGILKEKERAEELAEAHAKGILEAKLTPPLKPVVTDEQ